jgi:hypothetical protein
MGKYYKGPDPEEVARQINEEFYAEQRRLAVEEELRKQHIREMIERGEPIPVAVSNDQVKLIRGNPTTMGAKVKIETVQSLVQVCQRAILNGDIDWKHICFADSVLYTLEKNNEVLLSVGGKEHNFIFSQAAANQYWDPVKRYYSPTLKQLRSVYESVLAGQTTQVNLNELFKLSTGGGFDDKFIITIDLTQNPKFDVQFSRLITGLFGDGAFFRSYWNFLLLQGVEKLIFQLFKPGYILYERLYRNPQFTGISALSFMYRLPSAKEMILSLAMEFKCARKSRPYFLVEPKEVVNG